LFYYKNKVTQTVPSYSWGEKKELLHNSGDRSRRKGTILEDLG